MPLFRFHRGGLEDSLSTTKIVKTADDLVRLIIYTLAGSPIPITSQWGMKIEPYIDKDHCFDPRIGWYTHSVTADLFEKDKYHIVGFLSEPLYED